MQSVQYGLQLAKQTMAESNIFSLVGIVKSWIEIIPHIETKFFGYAMFFFEKKKKSKPQKPLIFNPNHSLLSQYHTTFKKPITK